MTTDEALTMVFNKIAWWKPMKVKSPTARSYKRQFLLGKLEFETKKKILLSLGYEVKSEMTWQLKKK